MIALSYQLRNTIRRFGLTRVSVSSREGQYKYHIHRKWKIQKSLKTAVKRKLLEKGQERANAGKRTAFSVGNKPVDTKKLLRDVKRDSKVEIVLNPTASGQSVIQQLLPGFGAQLGPSM